MSFKQIGIDVAKTALKMILAPSHALKRSTGLTKQKLNALSESRMPSDLLLHRTYIRREDEKFGTYGMANNRKGFVLRLTPSPYLGQEVEETIKNMLGSILSENISVQITTYKSDNVDDILKDYKNHHSNFENLNLDGKRNLEKIIENKIKYFKKWSKSSIMEDEDYDIRACNIINLVSVTAPKNMTKRSFASLYNIIKSNLEKHNPQEFNGIQLCKMLHEIMCPNRGSYDIDNLELLNINEIVTKGTKISLIRQEDKDKEELTIDDLFSNDGTFIMNNHYAKTLTTERFPRNTNLFDVQGAIFEPFGKHLQPTLPCRFLATLTISYDNVKHNSKIQAMKSKWNTVQLSFIPPSKEDTNPELRERREEYRNITEAIDNGELVLEGMYSVTLFEKDEDRANEIIELFKSRMSDLPGGAWKFKEETRAEIAFLNTIYSLPLQYSTTVKRKLKRFSLLFKLNCSKIIPLYGDFVGFGHANMLLIGRTGQYQNFSMYPSDTNSNFCLIGPPGTGKSTAVNELIINSLGAGHVVRSIDLGKSQEKNCQNVGGQIEEFTKESEKCLNFFTHILVNIEKDENGEEIEVIDSDELITIVPMIGMMAGVTISSSSVKKENLNVNEELDSKNITILIENALQIAYNRKKRNAGMQQVWEVLGEMREAYDEKGTAEIVSLLTKLTLALEDYVIVPATNNASKKGKYYSFFNGVNNLNFEKDYFLLEMSGLVTKSPEFALVVMLGILHKMSSEAFSREDVFKWYLIDEAEAPLKSPMFVNFLDNFGLRIRKHGGGVGIITQFIKHFFDNNASKSLYDAMAFKMFLEQEKEHIENAVDEGKLAMGDFEIELMKSIKKRGNNYSEIMIKHRGQTMIGRLKLDPFSLWMSRTDKLAKDTISYVSKHLTVSNLIATEVIVEKEEFPQLSYLECYEKLYPKVKDESA